MARSYRYVGPREIAANVADRGGGIIVDSVETLNLTLRSMFGCMNGESLTVTFVIGLDRKLRIADRRSEHVACANGENVFSAGEMTFRFDGDIVLVERVTNQSTGYCPEPESWAAVADALDLIQIDRPAVFDPCFVFRRCPSCSQINIVKDGWYRCEVCESPLPDTWNFD